MMVRPTVVEDEDVEDVRPTRQPFSRPSDGSHLRPTRVVRRSGQYQILDTQEVRPIMPDPSDFVNTFLYAGRFFVKLFTMKSVPQNFSFVKCFTQQFVKFFTRKIRPTIDFLPKI